MDNKISLRMVRDWLKDGGGAPTKAETLLEELLNCEISLADIRADIWYNERLQTNAKTMEKIHQIIASK